MAVNKVIFGGETVVDLTADTVTPETLAKGATAHDKSGQKITGTMEAGGGGGSGDGISLVVRNNTDTACIVGAGYANAGEEITVPVKYEWATVFSFVLMFCSECRVRHVGTYFDEGEWDLIEVDSEEEMSGMSENNMHFSYINDTKNWYFRNGSIIEINPI